METQVTRPIIGLVTSWLDAAGIPADHQTWLAALLTAVSAGLLVWCVYLLLSFVYEKVVWPRALKTDNRLDDHLLDRSVASKGFLLVCALLLRATLPGCVAAFADLHRWVTDGCALFVVLSVVLTVCSLINAVYLYLHEKDSQAAGLFNLKQTLQLISWIVGIVVGVSIVFHRTPLFILSGIGASAAVLMLVFRDTILGLMAGIQLNVNDMLRPGDWICAPKFDINGIVQKVGLTTVKVLNYDMSTITVPPYSLFTESFQNWKSMRSLRARRIMRSVCVDADTVRFLTPAELESLASEPWMKGVDTGRLQVNLALFRRWLDHTIASWPGIAEPDPERYIFSMVRELQPTPQGIPVEMYLFTTATEWADYERTQADLVDLVLASVSRFGLRVYQAPTAASLALR